MIFLVNRRKALKIVMSYLRLKKPGRTVFYGAERREAEANSPW